MSENDTYSSGTERLRSPREVAPTDVPVYLHRLGGRDTDGSQSVLTRWTFEAEQVRSVVENHLDGRVLNATAGKTRLDHDDVVRNDINPEMPADTHHDVQAADEHWPAHSFDGAVLDPPFDEGQAEQRYGGWHASDFSAAREALEPLVRPGGKAISLGWTTYGFAEQFDGWQREEIHIYQRGPVHPDVFLVVDEKVQRTLLADGGTVEDGTDRFDEYEEKLDELNRGLLTAYAAGFAKAVETFDLDPDFSTDVESLRENEAVAESHYYFWDGRVKPLNHWLREQFEIDADPAEDGGDGDRGWWCENCGYRPRLVHVDEPVHPCSVCGADEWTAETSEEVTDE